MCLSLAIVYNIAWSLLIVLFCGELFDPRRKGWVNEYCSKQCRYASLSLQNSQFHPSPESNKKRSIALKRYYADPEHLLERVQRMNEPETVELCKNKSLEHWNDPAYRKRVSDGVKQALKDPVKYENHCNAIKERARSDENRKRMSIQMKAVWADQEKATLLRIAIGKGMGMVPNKPETELHTILEDLFPGCYVYTGDFSFWVGQCNPDFTCHTLRKCVELFGDYWHRGEDPEIRISCFVQRGWECLVIWEHELSDVASLVSKLQKFHDPALIDTADRTFRVSQVNGLSAVEVI